MKGFALKGKIVIQIQYSVSLENHDCKVKYGIPPRYSGVAPMGT